MKLLAIEKGKRFRLQNKYFLREIDGRRERGRKKVRY